MITLDRKTLGIGITIVSAVLLLVLAFAKVNVDEQGAFLCEVVADSPTLSMDQCPAHNPSTSWLFVAAFGIAFVLFAGGVYMIFSPSVISSERKDQPKKDISKLDEDEKQIYTLLEKHEGSMYQSDLIKETDFSKVKITRILDRMATKGVVDRQRRGMTNIVVLK